MITSLIGNVKHHNRFYPNQWALNSAVEYLPYKEAVVGSIPTVPTIFIGSFI